MRVVVNGFFLGLPNTGSGQYVIGLLREMASLSSHEIVVLRPKWRSRARRREEDGEGGWGDQLRTVRVPVPLDGNVGKLWFEQVGVPLAARQLRAGLLHVPYLGSPFFSPCSVVVTIHDLIMKILPEYRGSRGVRAYTGLVCAAAKRADLTIADSNCTKKDIIRLLKTTSDRIRVVYLGCDERYFQRPDDKTLLAVRENYGLGERFILYIGGLDSRKNVSRLIEAFGRLKGDWELAIAGRPHSGNPVVYPALDGALRACGAIHRLKLLGFVPENDKPALYTAARLFVYPSLYEGFGLPPLEAMACGTPVVCSNTSSLPEVVGSAAAALVDPKDGDAMVQSMQAILEEDELAGELGQLAQERARQFTWRRTAAETLAVYDEVLRATKR